MTVRFFNNVASALASSASDSATTLTLVSGGGAKFPLSAGEWTYATLTTAAGSIEIVKVTGVAGDVLTVVRGQDGTTAQAFAAGDKVEARLTAQGLVDVAQKGSDEAPVQSVAGKTGSVTLAITDVSGLQTALDGKQASGSYEPANANIQSHIGSTSNPHGTTAAQVGLGNVTNNAQLKIASNLSDLNNTATARTNLGLGDAATKSVGTAAGTVAAGDHNHSGVYQLAGSYEPGITKAVGYAKWTGSAWSFVNETYLTSFTETDPVFSASAAAGVTTTKISNWDAAYGWGNHASAGYLASATAASTYQPLDGDLTSIAGLAGTTGFLKKTAANTWSLDTATYLTGNQSITVSGDASGSGATSISLTLANSGVSAGTYNDSSTAVRPFTVDAKGRITAIGAAVTVTPAWDSISSKPSTLSGYGISDAQPTLVSGTNIKTINGQSILGAGDLTIQGGVGVTLSGDADIYVSQSKTYTITNYNVFSDYVVQVSAGSVSISGDQISFTAPSSSQTVTLTVIMDDNATEFSLVVQSAGVSTPTNTSPSNNATDQNGTVTLTSSAFSWLGVSDIHLNSDWQLATDSAFSNVVQSASADTTNKTSWTVSGLSTSQTYYWRVRHRGTNNGASAWSTATSFVTKSSFSGLIGVQGQQGFGVGEYSGTLPSGFSALAGSSDKSSANYGNYQYSDGSIMVFVPRFYYRIGNAASPRYATYGANAIDIVGIDTYATEAAANTAGYAMHRAFKDGGADKSGFFIDKYLASKNGTTSCKSVQNGVPISLTTSATYTNSNGMTTGEGSCTGIYADAVLLARSRGVGTFNVASVFMYSALALLALAHAQASSNTTYCAWYDATNNFPKGCNNNALADTNDAGVTFTTAGDSGSANKPKTGSGSPFAKTTHNGQSCGVADLNGSLYQVMLGITNAGTSATDTTQKTDGNAYVLKTSVALSSLTYGWNGTNDAWGNTTDLATKYDLETGLFPWGSTTGWTYFGSGANQVFSGATSGISWKRTACGIQNATSGADATGTSQFGNDGCYQYNRANLFALSAALWNGAAAAGVFHRNWYGYRSSDNNSVGFRAGAYGS